MGFDIGGSKTEALVLGEAGELHRRREATPQCYDELLALVRTMVFDAERMVRAACSVGIGAPGSPNPQSGLHRNSNLQCMNGRAFQRDVSAVLGRDARVSNDANCMALSESLDGACSAGLSKNGAYGHGTVFGVIIGTGVGGGVVIDGRVLDGFQGIAGEWGHTPMPGVQPDEAAIARCYCGRTGCVEQFLAGPALKRRFGDQAVDVDWYAVRLAHALGTVVNILDPQMIVLAGGLSNLPDLAPKVQAALPQFAFSDQCATRVVRAKHGDSSGVRGAAWLGAK